MATRFLVGEVTEPQGVVVPENLKKKIARNGALLKQKTEAIAAAKKLNKVKRHDLKMRAYKYEREYKAADKKTVMLRRQAKANGNYFVEPQAKMLFVFRISGINKKTPKVRKILKLFRLDQLHKGVFLKCTKPVMNMLKCIQPFVICGYPNLKTTKMLLLKRGYAKVNRQRIPIRDNAIVSEQLGKFGIHGMDDLVHEIVTTGPNFKQVTNFLWPFKLSSPNGGYVLKKHGYHEPKGGDWGNREEEINEILRRMI